jgi:hypothetical protein
MPARRLGSTASFWLGLVELQCCAMVVLAIQWVAMDLGMHTCRSMRVPRSQILPISEPSRRPKLQK